MTTTQQLVVSVFRDRSQAEQAVNELLQAGFDNQQIRFAEQGTSTGGMLEKIKSVFTGQDVSAGNIYDDLVNMGTPPEDACYYQSEFEAGHTIVAVTGAGRMQEAITVLALHGGYGANQRFAQSANYGQGADAQVPATGEVNPASNREPVQQQGARNMQESQQTSTSNTYYDLVSVLYHALEAAQASATYVQDAQQSGNQDLANFFSEVQNNSNQLADKAKQLLGSASSSVRSASNRWPEENRTPDRPLPEENRTPAQPLPEENRTPAQPLPEENRTPAQPRALG
jgi:hypothetical protein